MVLRDGVIAKQGQRGILGDHDEVGSSVVVEVTGCESTRQSGNFPGRACLVRHVGESSRRHR